jgi:hypothetical protein
MSKLDMVNDVIRGSMDKQALGGKLVVKVIQVDLYRDTEAIGKMDPFV